MAVYPLNSTRCVSSLSPLHHSSRADGFQHISMCASIGWNYVAYLLCRSFGKSVAIHSRYTRLLFLLDKLNAAIQHNAERDRKSDTLKHPVNFQNETPCWHQITFHLSLLMNINQLSKTIKMVTNASLLGKVKGKSLRHTRGVFVHQATSRYRSRRQFPALWA